MKRKTLAALLAVVLGASMLRGYGEESGAGASTPPVSTTAESTDSSTASGTDNDVQLPDLTGHTLMIHCGAGVTRLFQEITGAPRSHTGYEVNVTCANADQIQSQIIIPEEDDLSIAGPRDELKPVESYVEGKKELVKHIPMLAVQSGNPRNIMGLTDLAGDGVALIMGDVDSAPIGKVAKKAMTDIGIFDQVRIEATTAAAPQMSIVLAAKGANAAIVRKEDYDAQDVETINTTDLGPYIKAIPAASLSYTADKDALEALNQYLGVDTAKEVWVKYGYEIMR